MRSRTASPNIPVAYVSGASHADWSAQACPKCWLMPIQLVTAEATLIAEAARGTDLKPIIAEPKLQQHFLTAVNVVQRLLDTSRVMRLLRRGRPTSPFWAGSSCRNNGSPREKIWRSETVTPTISCLEQRCLLGVRSPSMIRIHKCGSCEPILTGRPSWQTPTEIYQAA